MINSNTKQLDQSSKLYRALREFFWLSTYNWPSIKLTNKAGNTISVLVTVTFSLTTIAITIAIITGVYKVSIT